jgi:4-hydroxy-tetrahydrodipicolinate synthase
LVVLGTIGEGHILNETERGEIINTAVHTAKERVPVVVGIHACNVQDAIAQMQQARALGTTAVLVKYHGNPRASQRQVIDFYTALSDANILPILVYHFPSDTGIRLSPATVRAILCLANVIGIKESTLNLQQVAMHMKACHDLSKLYFSSTALDLTQFMNMGGHGAICPEAVILPRLTVECYQAIIDGRGAKARDRQKELFAMLPLYRQQIGGTATISRAVLMTAFDARLPLPIGPDASPVRLKEALNYLDVPTPTFAKPGEDALTRRDARQVRRTMAKVAPLAN